MSQEPSRRRNAGELQHQAEHTRPSHRSSIVGYLAVMFAVAFLLLLIAYFQQQRLNAEASNAWKESVSAVDTIHAMMEDNEKLRAKVEELEGQLSAKNEELTDANRSIQKEQQLTQAAQDQVYALSCLNKLRYLYNNDRAAARTYLSGLGDEADRIRTLLGEISASSAPEDMALYDPQKAWDQLIRWMK